MLDAGGRVEVKYSNKIFLCNGSQRSQTIEWKMKLKHPPVRGFVPGFVSALMLPVAGKHLLPPKNYTKLPAIGLHTLQLQAIGLKRKCDFMKSLFKIMKIYS